MDWRTIDGFLTDTEGDLLRLLSTDQIVLEIGSLFGRSTLCMAQVARHIHAIDPHRPGNCNFREHLKGRDTLAELRYNLRLFGVESKVSLHICTVGELWTPIDPIFGLVFIDGSHKIEAVTLDLGYAAKVLRPDGVIACHDHTSGHPGVMEAVKMFGRPVQQQVGGLAVIA